MLRRLQGDVAADLTFGRNFFNNVSFEFESKFLRIIGYESAQFAVETGVSSLKGFGVLLHGKRPTN